MDVARADAAEVMADLYRAGCADGVRVLHAIAPETGTHYRDPEMAASAFATSRMERLTGTESPAQLAAEALIDGTLFAWEKGSEVVALECVPMAKVAAECAAHAGRIYPVAACPVILPTHADCRCTWLPLRALPAKEIP